MADSSIRSLRSYTKSRTGCKSCKARKVKCDEARPTCASCLRRNLRCEYLTSGTRSHGVESTSGSLERHSNSSMSPSSSAANLNISLSVESTERRLLEMRLLHHFITTTVTKDFLSIHDETVFQMWVDTAPNLAFAHPFLLNIIISIAALHLWKISPDLQDMISIHRTYFNAAIGQHRKAVCDLSSENAEAVCISAILIALPAFTLLQNTTEGYSPPYQLFHLLSENVSLFGAAIPLLPRNSRVMAVITAKPNMHSFMKELQKDEYRSPFTKLLEWRAPGELIDQESQSAYEYALGYIGCILSTIEKGTEILETRRIIYALPTLLPHTFISRLDENNPRALVILAYYFSLVKAVDNVWWLRGTAEREVFGIQGVVPEQWQWAMLWPLQKLASYAAKIIPPSND